MDLSVLGRRAAGGSSTIARQAESGGEAVAERLATDLGVALVHRPLLERLIVEHGLSTVGTAAARDPKSELQERLQALGHAAPSYELVEERGPAHERWFRVRVSGAERALGEGEGRSKRVAETAAAAAALQALGVAT